MRESTRELFSVMRAAIERWSSVEGTRDAYVRGTLARKDLAHQIRTYRRAIGRREFIKRLQTSLQQVELQRRDNST